MQLRLIKRFSGINRFTSESKPLNEGKIAKSQGQIDSNLEDILNERVRIRKRIAEIQK